MGKATGVKKSFKTTTKKLKAVVKEYNDALKKLGEDLELLQTSGEDGGPVWNGKRAKKWIDKAVNRCYNVNLKDLKQLNDAVEGFSDHIQDAEATDDGGEDSISNWDLVN